SRRPPRAPRSRCTGLPADERALVGRLDDVLPAPPFRQRLEALPRSVKWYQALFGQPETPPAHDYATWQRAPLVLPRRRFRHGTQESTRSRRRARRGAARDPNTRTREFSLRDLDGYYVTINALSEPNKRVQPTKARGRISKSREGRPRRR